MSSSPFMIPMTNNAGTNGSGGQATPTTMSGGNFNFGNSANPNPTVPNSNPYGAANVNSTFALPASAPVQNPGAPAQPATPYGTGMPGTSFANDTPSNSTGLFGQTLAQEQQSENSVNATFGSGIGTELQQYLDSQGGYNSSLTQQTVDAQTAAMQQQIQEGMGNLQTNLAEAGISPNSSVSALETSNYEAQATTQENAITAQDFFNMWSQSQGNELNILDLIGGAGAAKKAGQSLPLSSLVGDIFGAAESAGSSYAATFP